MQPLGSLQGPYHANYENSKANLRFSYSFKTIQGELSQIDKRDLKANRLLESVLFYNNGKIKGYTRPSVHEALLFREDGSLREYGIHFEGNTKRYVVSWDESGNIIREYVGVIDPAAPGLIYPSRTPPLSKTNVSELK